MRAKLAVLTVALLALSGCASSTSGEDVAGPVAGELDGGWQLVAGTDTTGTFDLEDVPQPVTLEIDDRTASGRAPCNTFTGDFNGTVDGVDFGPLATTRMACTPDSLMRLETRYIAALEAVDTATLDGSTLTLSLNAGVAELVFEEVAPTPATGDLDGEWQLTGGNDAEGTMMLADKPVTLVIADASASGQAPCNTYTGGVEIDGETVLFGPFAQTLMACADGALTELENRYLAAIEQVDTWEISGDTLTLTGGEVTLQFAPLA